MFPKLKICTSFHIVLILYITFFVFFEQHHYYVSSSRAASVPVVALAVHNRGTGNKENSGENAVSVMSEGNFSDEYSLDLWNNLQGNKLHSSQNNGVQIPLSMPSIDWEYHLNLPAFTIKSCYPSSQGNFLFMVTTDGTVWAFKKNEKINPPGGRIDNELYVLGWKKILYQMKNMVLGKNEDFVYILGYSELEVCHAKNGSLYWDSRVFGYPSHITMDDNGNERKKNKNINSHEKMDLDNDYMYINVAFNIIFRVSLNGSVEQWYGHGEDDVGRVLILPPTKDYAKQIITGYLLIISLDFDGKKQWEIRLPSYLLHPLVGDLNGNIFALTKEGLYSFNRTGSLRWIYNGEGIKSHYQRTQRDDIPSGLEGGNFDNSTTISVTRDTIYLASENTLIALDQSKQNQVNMKWKYHLPMEDTISVNPSIDSNGNVLLGTEKGNVIAISNDGVVMWSFKLKRRISAQIAISKSGILIASELNLCWINFK